MFSLLEVGVMVSKPGYNYCSCGFLVGEGLLAPAPATVELTNSCRALLSGKIALEKPHPVRCRGIVREALIQ